MMAYGARALATPNIAVVKYWGKRDEALMLPTNSSLSFTMDEQLKTVTDVRFDPGLKATELTLDGRELSGKEMEGINKVFSYLRGKYDVRLNAKIDSKNYFPTAAGMASSASGYAALAFALNAALKLDLDGRELSILARLGSGSASRSIYGGFVEWRKGSKEDGSDCFAKQVADEDHWPEIRNVVAIVDAEKKKVSSREGMRATVKTSQLFKERLRRMDRVVSEMKRAVLARDFEAFARLTMAESNSLHSVMADTRPSIVYLNDVSRRIIEGVGVLNSKSVLAAYTFDAGPNAHLYTLEANVPAVKRMLAGIKGVKQLIVSRVGSGPRLLG
ncbi:MAG: diphosphomevalonate decarboxylase [Candidatus Micrarchaeota archaeon]